MPPPARRRHLSPWVGSPPHGPNPTDARLATHGQTHEEYELDPNHYERAGVRGERHQLHIDDQDSEDDDTNSGSDTRSVFNDPAGFYPEEPAARKAYGRLLAHRQDAEERARRHDEQHPPGVQGQVQARRRDAPDRGDDSTAIVRTGRTVAETALADARVKSRKANVAEIAAFVRTAGGTAGVGGVAADAMYGQTNRNDLCHLRGTLRRQDGIWVTFTKIQSHIEDAVADVATVRCPHMVGIDRYAWKRSPHIAISERITGYKQFGPNRGGSVSRKVYCAECWEKMEVKRLASAVRCADCGDNFPLSKTASFAVTRRLVPGAPMTSSIGEDAVDVCFMCAPRWDTKRAEEATRRGLVNDPRRKDAEDMAADAAAAELRAMPREERLRLLDLTLGARDETDAKKKNGEGDEDSYGQIDEDTEEVGAETAVDRRLRDAPDLYPWQVGHPEQRRRAGESKRIDEPPADIGDAAVQKVIRERDRSWTVGDASARGAPGTKVQMLPADRFKDPRRGEDPGVHARMDIADFAVDAMSRVLSLNTHTDTSDPDAVLARDEVRETFVCSLMDRYPGQLDREGARFCLEKVEDTAANAAKDAMNDLLANASGPVSEEEILAAALRRFNDDADAAMAEAARVNAHRTAAEFNSRAAIDAAEQETRALALDRRRLEDILGRDGGLQKYLEEEARLRGDTDDPYAALTQDDGQRNKEDETDAGAKKAPDDFWTGVDIEDDDADDLLTAEEKAEREREERERERRTRRDAERAAARAKLERWASGGMDFGEYGDDGEPIVRETTPPKAKTPPPPPPKRRSPMRRPSPLSVESPSATTPVKDGNDTAVDPGDEVPVEAPVVEAKPVNKWKMALAAIVKKDEPAEKKKKRRKKPAASPVKAALMDLFKRATSRREADDDGDDDTERGGRDVVTAGGALVAVSAEKMNSREDEQSLMNGHEPLPTHPKPRRGYVDGHDAGMDGVTIPLRDSLRRLAAEPTDGADAALGLIKGMKGKPKDFGFDPRYVSRSDGAGGGNKEGWSHAIEPKAFHAARAGGRRGRTVAEWVALSKLNDGELDDELREDADGKKNRGPDLVPSLTDRHTRMTLEDDEDAKGGGHAPIDEETRTAFETAVARRERRTREAHAKLRMRTLGMLPPSSRETGDAPGDEIDTRGEDESSFELPDEGTLGALLSGGEVLGRVDDLAARAAAAIEANKPKGAGRTDGDEVEGGVIDEPVLAVTTTVMDRKARIASLGLPPVDGAPDPLGVNPYGELPSDGEEEYGARLENGQSPAKKWIDQRGSKRTVPRLTGEPPVLTNAITLKPDPEAELFLEEARREKTRRIHEALRARARRMRDKAGLKAEEDLLIKGRFNVQTIVPSPATVKPPTKEGEWARKEREYYEEKERRWKEQKMRVSVAIKVTDASDDDSGDSDDEESREKKQRDVVSAAASRLWSLAEANKRKGERVVPMPMPQLMASEAEDSDVAPADSPPSSPPRSAPATVFVEGDFTAEAGFESGPPRTPETSPEPTPTKDPSPKPAVKASGSSGSSSESDVDDGKQDQDREEEAENREEEEDDWYSHLLPDPDRQRVTIHPYLLPTPERSHEPAGESSHADPTASAPSASTPVVLLTETASSDAEEKAATPSEPSSFEEEDEPSEEEEETRTVAVDTGEDEGETSGAESETEARIKLIAARTNFVRVDANRRAKLSPRKPHVSSLWADEVDPRATRRVLAGSYAFVDTPYDAVAGPRAHKKVAGMVRKDLRLAVAAAAGIDLDLKPRGFSLGLGFDAGDDGEDDDDDDRVRVVGISEGIPPEDRIAYGSRDDQTDAKFEKCFVAHFELELDDPRGRKSLGAGDKWSALRALHASLVDAVGPSVISGLGRGSLTIRGTGEPGEFPPPAPPPLINLLDGEDDDEVGTWAAVRDMAEAPTDPDEPTQTLDRDPAAPWEYRPLRALLGKAPLTQASHRRVPVPPVQSDIELHSVPWGAQREREPDERRYAAPTLDHALDKLVRVADAHARRLEDVDDTYQLDAECREREMERMILRGAAEAAASADPSVLPVTTQNGEYAYKRSLAELDADARAARRDLEARAAGDSARAAARAEAVYKTNEPSKEGVDPKAFAPETLPSDSRRRPLWDVGDVANVDDAYDMEYVNPRQMRRARGGGTSGAVKPSSVAKEPQRDENEVDDYSNPRLGRLRGSSRGSARS